MRGDEAAATTEIQLRHKSDLPVDIRSCQGSRLYSLCILHFVDKGSTLNSIFAVVSTQSVNSSVEELSNKERELTEIKSCSTGSKVQGRVDCVMEAHEPPAVPEELRLSSIQHSLKDSLLGDDKQCHTVAGKDDEDIEALFRSVDSYSDRLEKEERQSEMLTHEVGDLRAYLERLWNELMETKEQLRRDFPIEEIQTSRVNNGSKSGCNLTIPEDFEISSLTEANYSSSQDFSLEAKAMIHQLSHVEICCSSEVDSHELLFSEEEVWGEEQESWTPSACSFYEYSETSSTLDDLIEEQLGQFEELESGQIERSLEPNFEALLSAYDIESIVDEFIGREEDEEEDVFKVEKDPALLNSAMSIYNDDLNKTRPKSKLHESSTVDDPDPGPKCDGVSHMITQEEESGELKKEESLSCLETTQLGSLKQARWTEQCPEVFEEEKRVEDGDLVEVYKQETKELAANKKRLWFFFKQKRVWPRCPKRTHAWFHKLFRKFRIFPRKGPKHK